MKLAVVGEVAVASRVARDLAELGHDCDVFESVSAVGGADAIIGCFEASPDLEVAGCSAALDIGAHYISSCYDEESWDALRDLHDDAKGAGVAVLPAVGWTPGISNVLCRHAAEEIEGPLDIRIAWSLSASAGRLPLVRALHSLSGSAVIFENGRWGRSPAGEAQARVFFPEPVGWREVRTASGLEAITLPESLEGVKSVIVRGGLTEAASNWLSLRIGNAASLAPQRRKRAIGALAGRLIPSAASTGGLRRTWCALRVDVSGVSEGVTYGLMDLTSNLRSVPLVVAAQLVGAGEVEGIGVIAPERAFRPGVFIEGLARRGVRVARLQPTR